MGLLILAAIVVFAVAVLFGRLWLESGGAGVAGTGLLVIVAIPLALTVPPEEGGGADRVIGIAVPALLSIVAIYHSLRRLRRAEQAAGRPHGAR